MPESETILQVALPVPLPNSFDYLSPGDFCPEDAKTGARVLTTFRNKKTIGILLGTSKTSKVERKKLKPAIRIIDKDAIIPENIMQLCLWASDYYHYPIGEVLTAAIPTLLRKGERAQFRQQSCWRLTKEGLRIDVSTLSRAPKQKKILSLLKEQPEGCDPAQIKGEGITSQQLLSLQKKGWLEKYSVDKPLAVQKKETEKVLELNPEQQTAFDGIQQSLQQFKTFLL